MLKGCVKAAGWGVRDGEGGGTGMGSRTGAKGPNLSRRKLSEGHHKDDKDFAV